LEIRKDGNEFVPNSLHCICAGIMRFLRANGQSNADIFTEQGFLQFWMVLDSGYRLQELEQLKGKLTQLKLKRKKFFGRNKS